MWQVLNPQLEEKMKEIQKKISKKRGLEMTVKTEPIKKKSKKLPPTPSQSPPTISCQVGVERCGMQAPPTSLFAASLHLSDLARAVPDQKDQNELLIKGMTIT